ncbi:VCBS repeat-containing protein, partial [Pseudoxanthomonas sp. SGD-10]
YQTEAYSNIKIISRGVSPYGSNFGPAYFEIHYPDGSKAFYGSNTNSRTQTAYAITYIENPNGIRTIYNYLQNGNTLAISQIAYSGTDAVNSSINQVNFYYTTASRGEQAYVAGTSLFRDKILNKISIVGSGVNFRHYQLTYDNMLFLNYQRLKSIQAYTGDETGVYQPIKFTYNMGSYEIVKHTFSNLNVSQISRNNMQVVTADFTGNGSMDFLLYPNAKDKFYAFYDPNPNSSSQQFGYQVNTGLFKEIFPASFLLGNGQMHSGQGIIVVKPNGSNNYKLNMYAAGLSQPVFFQYEKEWGNVPRAPQYYSECDQTTYDGDPLEMEFLSGDFNGDGLTDIMAINNAHIIQHRKRLIADICSPRSIYIPSSAYFINMDRRLTSGYVMNTGDLFSHYVKNDDKLYTSDFNGDGKTDILHVKGGNMYVYSLNQNNTLELLWQTSDSRVTLDHPILIGDYNGDGKMDIMFSTGYNSHFATFISSGKGFIKSEQNQPFANTEIDWDGSKLETYYLIPNDIDGDGKTDIMLVRTTTFESGPPGYVNITVHYNSGATASLPSNFSSGYTSSIVANIHHYPIPLFLNTDKPNYELEFGFISDDVLSLFKFQNNSKTEGQIKEVENNFVKHQLTYKSLVYDDGLHNDIPVY